MALPEKKFRAGTLSVRVWKNEVQNQKGETITFKTVNFQRGYKDKDNNWKNTASLRIEDLPKLQLLLGKAFDYLISPIADGVMRDKEPDQDENVPEDIVIEEKV